VVNNETRSGCLGVLLALLGIRGPEQSDAATFRLRDDFLSAAELSFYRVLESVVSGRATICPKVNLADVFFVSGASRRQSQWNRISRKHVDFLICSANTMKPLAGIELDDASHGRADRQERDAMIKVVFEQAGLPLLRVPARRGYSTAELEEMLTPVLSPNPSLTHTAGGAAAEVILKTSSTASTLPLCPKCGIPMVLRTGQRGAFQGKQFYGCQNYPRCRELIPV
jgi:very-short-patch-repair endonuclease